MNAAEQLDLEQMIAAGWAPSSLRQTISPTPAFLERNAREPFLFSPDEFFDGLLFGEVVCRVAHKPDCGARHIPAGTRGLVLGAWNGTVAGCSGMLLKVQWGVSRQGNFGRLGPGFYSRWQFNQFGLRVVRKGGQS